MIIENDHITAEIDIHGAELTSLKKKGSDEELIWTAQKEYWNRHAPMLFPIVGKVWNGEYRVGDKVFNLPQHGFARDREFKVLCHDKESVVLCLESDVTPGGGKCLSFNLYTNVDLQILIVRHEEAEIASGDKLKDKSLVPLKLSVSLA